MIRIEHITVRVPYSFRQEGEDYGTIYRQWRTVTKRVYRHDGCEINHFVRRVAERCAERLEEKQTIRLFPLEKRNGG